MWLGVFLCRFEVEEGEKGYTEAQGRYSSLSGGDRQVVGGEERG